MVPPLMESGCYSDVTFTEHQAVKTSQTTFETHAEVERLAGELQTYTQLLGAEPLRTAALYEVSVIGNADSGYRLRHVYERIAGVSLKDIQEESARHTAVRATLAQIAAMRTLGDDNTVAVPADIHAQNIYADMHGPALIDMWPALLRRPDGSFPVNRIGPRLRNAYPEAMGAKTGIMTKLLSSVIDRGDSITGKLVHVARRTDNWCYDVLPADLPAALKRPLERQIRGHFIPYLVTMAQHRACQKLGC